MQIQTLTNQQTQLEWTPPSPAKPYRFTIVLIVLLNTTLALALSLGLASHYGLFLNNLNTSVSNGLIYGASAVFFLELIIAIVKSKKEPLPDLGIFPEHTYPLSNLSTAIANVPNSNIYERITQAAKQDAMRENPSLNHRKTKEDEPPSLVYFPDQDFILSRLPKKEEVADYFDLCLKHNVKVMISAHERSDAIKSNRCGNFWELDRPLQVGEWTLTRSKQHLLREGTVENSKGELPRIVQTTLLAEHPSQPSRTIEHFHYEGWVDGHAAPDLTLLKILFHIVNCYSPNPDDPIAINCHAGRGRTLNVGAAYLLLKKLSASANRGENIKEMPINLLELIYDWHRQRDLDLRNVPPQDKDYFHALYSQILTVVKDV